MCFTPDKDAVLLVLQSMKADAVIEARFHLPTFSENACSKTRECHNSLMMDMCCKSLRYFVLFCFFIDGKPESRIDFTAEPGKWSTASKHCVRKMVIAG